MSPVSVAERYHHLTKYTPENVRGGRGLDWRTQPLPFKDYASGQEIALARYLPDSEALMDDRTLAEWRAGLSPYERAWAELSHLLFWTNGVTAVVEQPGEPFLMRAAPSAGGLYPTEIYLVANGHAALPDGLYNYQVRDHSLVRFWHQPAWERLRAACFDHPALAEADLAVVFSAVFFRSAWRYHDRAYRRVLLDTGHVLGNLTLAAPLIGRHAAPIGGFADEALSDMLFLEPGEEEALAVVALLPQGADSPGPSALPSLVRPAPPTLAEGQRLVAVHEAGKIAAEGGPSPAPAGPAAEKYAFAFGEPIGAAPIDWGGSLGPTILKRRSTRAFSGEAFSRESLGAILDFTYHPEQLTGPWSEPHPGYFAPELLQTFVAVHAIEGLDPGCYHYAVARRELRQIRFTSLRDEVQYLALGQELAGEAAAVVFHTADLPLAVARYGDRAYRYLHLDAGQLGERLNLAALKLGLGASGIGGFFDDQVNELLGIPTQEAVVYLTTLGVPAR